MIFLILGTKCTKTNKLEENAGNSQGETFKFTEGNLDKDECQLDKMATQIKSPKETAGIIRWYEMLNTKKAKFSIIVLKHAQLLKQFTKSEEFYEKAGLSRSSTYFKTNLYQFLLKYPFLKTSYLPFHYFKNDFKKIKVCNLNGSFFQKK